MLTYTLNDDCSTSLYEQLYELIKSDILSGNLKKDAKLPSIRSFSKNLGISTITVKNTYTQLVSEGYLYSLEKKGYFVSDISINIKQSLNSSKTSLTKQKSSSKYFADFVSNQINQDNFPFSIWAKLMREIITDKNEDLLKVIPAQGIIELREAISKYLYEFRGMQVDVDQIIIGAGTEYLYGLIIQLLGRDKVFAVEDPGYQIISKIYEVNDVSLKYIPLDSTGIDMDKLEESNADIIHISPSHHYPTGIVTPITKRYELLSWASKKDSRYIIEDDYDSEFRLIGKPIPALQSIDIIDKVIYINTFSKSLSPAFRISYMVIPKQLLKIFNERLSFYSCTVSSFEQYTLAKFISDGYFEKHINRMRVFYRNQRDLILKYLNESPISKSIIINEENSGLHFLLKLNTNISDDEIIEKAKEKGIKISFLSEYYHNKDLVRKHVIVINYSGIEKDRIKQAIDKLTNIIKN